MDKRERVREGIDNILVGGIDADGHFHCEKTVIALLAYLHSEGCVLKVDKELPPNCVVEESTGRWFTLIDGMWTQVSEPEISAIEPLIE